MIKNIILCNVSSYAPDANSNIGPLTRVNVFYGHNGTGKEGVALGMTEGMPRER